MNKKILLIGICMMFMVLMSGVVSASNLYISQLVEDNFNYVGRHDSDSYYEGQNFTIQNDSLLYNIHNFSIKIDGITGSVTAFNFNLSLYNDSSRTIELARGRFGGGDIPATNIWYNISINESFHNITNSSSIYAFLTHDAVGTDNYFAWNMQIGSDVYSDGVCWQSIGVAAWSSGCAATDRDFTFMIWGDEAITTPSGPTPGNPPTITLLNPNDDTINDTLQQIFTYNVSVNADTELENCSLWTNSSGSWELNLTNTTAVNGTNGFVLTLPDQSVTEWNINCYDNNSNNSWATSNYTIISDTIIPIITEDDIEGKVVWYLLAGQINLSDDNLFSFNFSINDTEVENGTNLGLTEYQYNYSYDVLTYPLGINNATMRTCDGHTNTKLVEPWEIDKFGDGLKITTDKKWFNIESTTFDLFDNFETNKLRDRYEFIYEIGSQKTSYTFAVTSTEKIYIPQNKEKYKGWLVIPTIGENGRWIDFNLKNVPNPIYSITRVKDNEVLVTVSNIPSKVTELHFESTGELNCIQESYYWNNTGQLIVNATDTVTGGAVTTFDVYKDSILQGSTTNGTFYLPYLNEQSYTIRITNPSYASTSSSIAITSTNQTYQFSLYTANSINITIRDEVDNSVVDDVNVSLNFISDSYNYTYSTDNGTIYIDDLGDTIYTIRYRDENQSGVYGARFRHHVFTLTNDTHNELTLYLISSPDVNISVIAYDQTTLNKLENVIVYLQRRFSHDNVYRTTAMYETDLAGTAYFEADITEYYKFLADYPFGERKYNSEKLYFESDTYNIYLDLNLDVGDKWFEEDSITFNLNYLDTKEFQGTYSDTEGVATEFCLYLKKYVQYGQTTVNSSCSTSSSGTLEVGGMNENITYYGTLTAKIGGDERIVASAWKEFVEDELDSGEFGYFMTAVLVIVFAFLSIIHVVALILGVLALVFAKLLGIFVLGWSEIIVIFIVSIFLAMIIQLVKR